MQIEEADETISEGAYHVGLELVHGNGQALLLRHHEIHAVLHVIQVPNLDDAIRARTPNQIVLIKLVETCIGRARLRLELIRRDVLKVRCCERVIWRVARLQLYRQSLEEIEEPEGAIGGHENCLSGC